jgi:hypothetical protein
MKPVTLEVTMMKIIGELKAERIHDLNQIGGLQEENARLKAEVERLRASSFVTAVPAHQYERVIKAGDAMASTLQFEETLNDSDRIPQSVQNWNAAKNGWDAAKEGKGQP